MASVEIRDLRKSFGPIETIHGVTIDVPDGEFVALVGPSGCGKSTILRLLAGLEEVTAGTISIGGRVINEVEPKHRDIAMVFQNYALYPHMTVAENMGFSMRLLKKSKEEIRREVGSAAEILGLTPYLGRYPKQLSGGQRQRVAMGRAIVRQPQVFLFDEPLSNLDAQLRVQMRAELKAIHNRLKVTTIYVTHDQVEAMTMADRIVVMKDGYVMQAGAPLDLYDQPANTFVARFVGSPSMNIFAADVSGGQVQFAGTDWCAAPADLAGAVQMGIRPEHFTIGEGGAVLAVENVDPTGSETLVQGQLGGVPATVLLRTRAAVRAGDLLPVAVRPELIHLFDAESGDTLPMNSEGL
ncbi:multiple sugar transport system ATP-binding protein [Devosia subaequoris]|uniref:Multiple sugar transport system ATP-binding protein n=1 Tax=Devosia subaequoris TaxID=395930 RepID=A0A7W6IR90_9HYPH|nr:sn-glycerol-3-phosphate ABC transporter ATP-binding protein UgpC [Devosia subaequoris]MBB4053620.1 multiple sugar transport system ATP-binding protein [Devosia subaequoris]MCP1211244.1 sn-glycerol-3-phosphate ABC transporter ATP-binding protein UgpC [Devosia subaequoris]